MQLELHYSAPFQPHSPTSKDAAKEIRPHLGRLQRKVYDYIVARGQHGATDCELEYFLGLIGSTVRPRRVELQRAELIRDSGMKRLTQSGRKAVVWIAKGDLK